jgi:aminoglycoside N3'-acetyltransferase
MPIPSHQTLVEWAARQTYWRFSQWIDPVRARLRKSESVPTRVRADRFLELWLEKVPTSRGPYLLHSSTTSFELLDDTGLPLAGLSAAAWLLNQLKQHLGPSQTLCLPTHPKYTDNPGFMFDKSQLKLTYDMKKTPSSVGLISELFRRQGGSLRSLHPLSSVAAQGPLAAELLHNNLNDSRPLPHGIDSPYYRICRAGGTVLGLGIPLIKAMTILHVAEEVCDGQWPVPGFFYERQFRVVDGEGTAREAVVRERRPEYVRSLILSAVRHDLLREGLLREYSIDGVPIATADAQGVLEYMQNRQQSSTYPYLLPRIAGWGRPRRAGEK